MEIKTISLNSTEYPARLKNIRYPPKVIYYLGDSQNLNNKYNLGVVGSRKFTPYGKQVLSSLIPDITRAGITVVSGLARGIDIIAHKKAIDSGGKATVVLAGGLDQIYPPEHRLLANIIMEKGGILLSEFAPGTPYLRQHFPARNRIISGLSDAVLVVEAKKKSGALITAEFAFSQKRTVFAVPGNIFSPQSQGVNSLFKKSALPVTKSEDILDFFFPRRNKYKRYVKTRHARSQKRNNVNLTKEEKEILDYISSTDPTPINSVIRRTKISSAKVISLITELELRGLLESEKGIGYVKTI